MTDDEILAIMLENEKLKKAITEIAEYDPTEENGYMDEDELARSFWECQAIAKNALIA